MTRWYFLVLAAALPAAEWPQHTVAADFRTNTATAADFTGDGKPDVIANDGPARQDVLFVAPEWKRITLSTRANSIYSAALDMDGDGDLDYVAAQYTPGLLYWLERPRDPLKDAWAIHILDDAANGGIDGIHGLAIADVNGDGKPDLIANSGQPKGKYPNSAAWFEAPAWKRHIFAAADAPGLSHYFGTGDVNSDRRLDIALAAKIPPDGNWFAWWEQPASRTGPWRKHLIAANHEGASNIAIVDVNGDRKPDFLASRGHGTGVLWFEAPSWTPHIIDEAIEYPHSLAVADLDGDGDPDAVACSAVYSRKPANPMLAWYENNGKGSFRVHRISANQASYHVTLTDMDGDKDLDILVAGQESRNVTWYENRLNARPAAASRR